MNDTTLIKNYNHVTVPQMVISVKPATPPNVIVNSVDYSFQFWGLLLVILVLGLLFYFKKNNKPVTIASQWDPSYVLPASTSYTTNTTPLDIDEAKPKVNLNFSVGESSLTSEVSSKSDVTDIKEQIKNLRR